MLRVGSSEALALGKVFVLCLDQSHAPGAGIALAPLARPR